MKFLFLDTETTGLPTSWKAPPTDFESWPRVVELGVIRSDDVGNILEGAGFFIKPDGFEIPAEASAIHGITTEMATNEGVNGDEAFEQLYAVMRGAEYIVGHNINFDIKVVSAEFARRGWELPEYKKVCTMLGARSIFGKWPKLHELYKHLFLEEMKEAHRAFADISATAECFMGLLARGFFPELEIPDQVWQDYMKRRLGK